MGFNSAFKGLIFDNYNCCFHISCADTSPSLTEYSMSQDCMLYKYQKHARYQKKEESGTRKKELNAAREKINALKPGNNSRKNEDQDISDDLSN